jgi:hypothetical protein
MGVLGLINLEYLTKEFSNEAKEIHNFSLSKENWFPFCAASNI